MLVKLLLAWVGLTIGNFIWVWAVSQFESSDREITDAIEISYFQAVAFLLVYLFIL